MFLPFTFIFYNGNSMFGKLIRKFTNGRYSHVAMFIDEFHLIQLDYKTPLSIQHFGYPKKSYDVYKLNIELTDTQKNIIINFIKNNLSTSYDYKFILSRLCNILFSTRIVSAKDKYTCDELIIAAFNQIGINLLDDSEMLSPESLSNSKYLTKVY